MDKSARVKVALITGAASGIGRGIAFRLAKDGMHVALNDLPSSREGLVAVAEEIKRVAGAKECSLHFADVSSEEQVQKMIADVVETYGGLDIMVANAGIVPTVPFLETPVELWDKVFAINVRGTFLCYKYAGIQMVKQGKGGRIIGASSLAGKSGVGDLLGAYAGTKFAIRGITQAVAGELGKHKITVNAYAPGLIDTPALKEFIEVKAKNANMQPEQFFEAFNASVPLGYAGTPEDIGGLVSYLVSEEAHFITGQTRMSTDLYKRGYLLRLRRFYLEVARFSQGYVDT
ncbi:hypothetical protein D9758_019040 [Tetrapyrgos nigripes]|uniref:NAD(P)-binding protein n=1 Tax=Tetrapyrgos nigripes TaxID=182062 RepID=A0A8H5ETB4_9AGAR|nr:hypothetical protein D9758_019040 [Tetrapyrgos nigripes]